MTEQDFNDRYKMLDDVLAEEAQGKNHRYG